MSIQSRYPCRDWMAHHLGASVMVAQSTGPYVRLVQVANPAAGAEFRLTGPGQGLWRVLALHFHLATSAVVATRIPQLVQSDGLTDYLQVASPTGQTASTSVAYSAFPGAPYTLATLQPVTLPAPTDGYLLLPGHSVRSSTSAIGVADQYSAIAALVMEYPTGPIDRYTPDVYMLTEPKG